MILFVGQVDAGFMGREGFQEVDYRRCSAASPSGRPRSTDRAHSGNRFAGRSAWRCPAAPGPWWSALPEDVLFGSASWPTRHRCASACRPHKRGDLTRLGRLLAGRRTPAGHRRRQRLEPRRVPRARAIRARLRPAGRSVVSAPGSPRQSRSALRRPAGPGRVAAACRSACARPTSCWSSAPALPKRRPRGFTLVESPLPRQTLIHIHADSGGTGPRLRRATADQRRHAGDRRGARRLSCRRRQPGWRALDACRPRRL